jgi:hypothetical protein
MTAPLLRIAAWRRFHPLARYGYDLTRQGIRRGDTPAVWMGVAFIAAGLAIRRRAMRPFRRTMLYRTELAPDEAVTIKVIQDDREIEVVDVTGE